MSAVITPGQAAASMITQSRTVRSQLSRADLKVSHLLLRISMRSKPADSAV
jgi:hypothetical protein